LDRLLQGFNKRVRTLSKQQFIEMSTKLDIPNTWLRKYFS